MVESFRVELSARPVPERFFFHSRLLGFSAEGCEISGLEGGASWEVEVLSRPDWAHASPDFVPIPIDMGLLLESLPYWRHPDFEVFRWSLFPEILVFDSRTYAVQSRLFHRLAFFAEKRGFRGRLYADSHIAGRHGWNAHNYSARGLADFFETARATSFSLNSEERWLEGYLLAQGVIRREGGAIVAGRGGVLGISRESSPSSRSMLLTHEAFHGVFYGLPEYRRLVEDTWAALPDEQRDFWNFFFTWMGYDVTDLYLLVNEFQAYLLQQGVSQADAYYKGVIASRLAESRPERKVWLERLFAAEPDMFTRPARIFSAYLERAVGIRAGNVRSVQPISR
jgi:hypothetical protein